MKLLNYYWKYRNKIQRKSRLDIFSLVTIENKMLKLQKNNNYAKLEQDKKLYKTWIDILD